MLCLPQIGQYSLTLKNCLKMYQAWYCQTIAFNNTIFQIHHQKQQSTYQYVRANLPHYAEKRYLSFIFILFHFLSLTMN